jgi:phosphoglycolate phosphatase
VTQIDEVKFKVSAVMIDLDGTLIHTAPQIAEAANLMLADLNFPVQPQQKVESYIGAGAQMLVKRCLTQQLGNEPDAGLFVQAEKLFFARYAENAAMSKPYDGVIEGLQSLWNKGYRLACVTNKPEQFTLPLLKKAGLADFFDIVVSGDSLPNKKPDPIQLHHICAKLDVPEFEAMLVGDSATDIAAAHAAGCYIVTVPYGYNQGMPIDISQVDATIDDLTNLIDILI